MWALYRRTAPAVLDPALNMWLLTGHRVCRAALLDPTFSAAQGQQQRLRDDELPVSMLTTDGAHHQLLRAPAAAASSARAVLGCDRRLRPSPAIGGFEPLGDLIATALHLLLDLPDVRTRLRTDPALIPRAVDETLRQK